MLWGSTLPGYGRFVVSGRVPRACREGRRTEIKIVGGSRGSAAKLRGVRADLIRFECCACCGGHHCLDMAGLWCQAGYHVLAVGGDVQKSTL